jgi:deoxyribonuclease V
VKLAVSHAWNLPVKEAEALQKTLAAQVVSQTTFDPHSVKAVAGIDVSFRGEVARAAVVVLSFPQLEALDLGLGERPITFPYVPGLLAFREGPAVLAALEALCIWPDVVILDAQGLAHPRRLGLASHVGVILDQPTIGCAKSRLVGRHEEPGSAMGDAAELISGTEVIGTVLRTKPGTRPLYVSIGHRIDLPTARQLVLACVRGYRLPEPTRLAHQVAGGAELKIQPDQPRSLSRGRHS